MKKRKSHRLVTFEDELDRLIWLKANIAVGSDKELMRMTGESQGQVTYRLRVLKETLGLRESVRQRWKNGHHPLIRQFMEDYSSIMLAELDRQVVPKLVHPTPKTIRIKE